MKYVCLHVNVAQQGRCLLAKHAMQGCNAATMWQCIDNCFNFLQDELMQQASTATQLPLPAKAHLDLQHQVQRQAQAIATLQMQLNSVLQQAGPQALGTDRPSAPVQAVTSSGADRLPPVDAATQAGTVSSAETVMIAQVAASDRYNWLQPSPDTKKQGAYADLDSSCSAGADAEHHAGGRAETLPLESSQGTVADEQHRSTQLKSNADRFKTNGDNRQAVQRHCFRWLDGPCRFL